MGNVSVILVLFFVIFGILGVSLFSGKFYSCNDTSVDTHAQCVGAYTDPSTGAPNEAPLHKALACMHEVGV